MHTKRVFLQLIVFSIFFSLVGPPASTNLWAESSALGGSGPSWNCGDWWVLEQSKLDISKPTPVWKEPVPWRFEVKCPEGQNLMVLEIRSLSGLKTGVDVFFSKDPWEVKRIRKTIATAEGLKVLEQELNTRGPVVDLQSPFALVLPGFPLADIEDATLTGGNGASGASARPEPFGATISDSSKKKSPLRVRYRLSQKVGVPSADDLMLQKGRDSMGEFKGENVEGLLNPTRVEIQQGRATSVQLWSQDLPWAVVEEAPHTKTHLIEFHKGVAK